MGYAYSSCLNDKRTKNYSENRYERHHCFSKGLSSFASQGINKIKNRKNNKPTQTAAGITGEQNRGTCEIFPRRFAR